MQSVQRRVRSGVKEGGRKGQKEEDMSWKEEGRRKKDVKKVERDKEIP